jgi:hypothetical protein
LPLPFFSPAPSESSLVSIPLRRQPISIPLTRCDTSKKAGGVARWLTWRADQIHQIVCHNNAAAQLLEFFVISKTAVHAVYRK